MNGALLHQHTQQGMSVALCHIHWFDCGYLYDTIHEPKRDHFVPDVYTFQHTIMQALALLRGATSSGRHI